jgi:integrase
LNFAVRTDRLQINPAKGLIRFREETRDRIIKTDELQRLLSAIEAEGEPWADTFNMLLFTGARRGSVAAMGWEDVDLSTGIWTIPAKVAKNKTAPPYPLPNQRLPYFSEGCSGVQVSRGFFPAQSATVILWASPRPGRAFSNEPTLPAYASMMSGDRSAPRSHGREQARIS